MAEEIVSEEIKLSPTISETTSSDSDIAELKKRVAWLEDQIMPPIFTSVPSHTTGNAKFILYQDTTNGIYRLYVRLNNSWQLVGSSQLLTSLSLDGLSDAVITSVAQGDVFYYNGTNWVNLGPGTNRYTLQTGGASANPAWAVSPQSVMTAQGDILYASAANTLARLAPGTSGQFLKTQGASANPTWADAALIFKNGVFQRAGDTVSGTQTIAHGLGITPKYVRMTARKWVSSNVLALSDGVYNGTTTSCVHITDAASNISGNSSVNIITVIDSTGNDQTATIAIDATNITLTWTKAGSPSAEGIMTLWEAWA